MLTAMGMIYLQHTFYLHVRTGGVLKYRKASLTTFLQKTKRNFQDHSQNVSSQEKRIVKSEQPRSPSISYHFCAYGILDDLSSVISKSVGSGPRRFGLLRQE